MRHKKWECSRCGEHFGTKKKAEQHYLAAHCPLGAFSRGGGIWLVGAVKKVEKETAK